MNKPADKYPLFFAHQLVTHDGRHMITWAQSRLLSRLSAKGKKAIWFKHLEWLFSQNDSSRLLKDGLRRNKEWIVFKRRKEYQVAKITMKSHKKDMLSVEIWNIASFDPHLGNLYQLEKPARSLTLDIPRKSARTLNMEAQSHCTNDDSSPTSISESIEYSESDIASTPAIVIDQDRLIDISLKKRSHGSIIDSNARSNIKWDPNTNEVAQGAAFY
ncbi:uncharacterized protein OCT59_001438 [Rhizophagus irregularis]|uniref:uncharacterized protein n=1 Tax=Rhizophagus irregularis TaxID=588596 RepID=UPI00331FBB4D|nr:hypothetical protein OCT59_001438 [Rhizophagus irregularis]